MSIDLPGHYEHLRFTKIGIVYFTLVGRLFPCMRAPRLLLCVLECGRAVVELVGLESPWLVSGHTSILARYYDH